MQTVGNKKPATQHDGSLRDIALPGEQTELHSSVTQFCTADERNASGSDLVKIIEARRQVASTLANLSDAKPSRPAGMPIPMAIEDRPLEYADLQFVRDLVDLFGGRLANDKYKRGRLAGLAVCLYGDHIEVYGPLQDATGLEPVGFWGELPQYGWRAEESDVLYRADPAMIAHLAAEARKTAQRKDLAQNLFDLSDGSESNRQAQADGKALRDSSRSADLVDMVCALNRCKFVGLAPDDDAINGRDDEIVYRTDTLEWMFEGDDVFVARLKTSSPQKLTVIMRTCDGGGEHELGRIRELSDILVERVEAIRATGVEVPCNGR